MFGHCAFVPATTTLSGLMVGNLRRGPTIQPLTWVLQIMPLFLPRRAASAAYGLDRAASTTTMIASRGRVVADSYAAPRARPVFWYLGAWTLVLIATQLFAGPTAASRLGAQVVALLWFIGVYLVILAFVPALVPDLPTHLRPARRRRPASRHRGV